MLVLILILTELFIFPYFNFRDNNKILSRRIFDNKRGFLEFEIAAIEKLEEEIIQYNKININKKLNFPINWKKSVTLKFLQSSKFNNKTTIQNMINHIEWKLGYFPFKITENAIEILSKTGFLYCHGRDRSFRPIIVCRAESYLKNLNKYSYDDWINAIVFFVEYVVNYLLVPGQIENWNIIADLTNVSLFGLPTDFQKILKFLQSNYRARLFKVYVHGMNKFLEMLWKIIKTFLQGNVEKKIMFINDSNKNSIFENILPHQLEFKYGGSAKNLIEKIDKEEIINVKSLFPPIIPNNDFLQLEDKIKIISENEYINYFKIGKITKLSPYLPKEFYESNLKNFDNLNTRKDYLNSNSNLKSKNK